MPGTQQSDPSVTNYSERKVTCQHIYILFTSLCLHLGSTNQREGHCFVLAHGHIFHQAAPERIVKFRNRLGQLFQFRNEPFEFPPADTALTDVSRRLFTLCLCGLVLADSSIVGGVVQVPITSSPKSSGKETLTG